MHNSRLILFGILLLVLCQPIPAKKNPRYLVDVPQLCVNGDQEPKQWPHDVPFTIDGLHIVTGSGVRMHVKCTCNAGFTGPLCNETAIPDADEETSFEITNSKEETEEEETDPQSEEYDPLIPVRRGPCVHGFIERGECQCYDGYKGYSCDAVKCSEYGEEVPGASFCKCQSHYAGRLCNACLNIMLTYPNCVEEIDSVEVANDKVNDIRNWITNHGIETVIIIVAGSALLIIGGLTICCLCSKFCCRKPKQQRKGSFTAQTETGVEDTQLLRSGT